jgi:hypothetical protein
LEVDLDVARERVADLDRRAREMKAAALVEEASTPGSVGPLINR